MTNTTINGEPPTVAIRLYPRLHEGEDYVRVRRGPGDPRIILWKMNLSQIAEQRRIRASNESRRK